MATDIANDPPTTLGPSATLTPPLTIDGTGLTSTVPLLIKNGKAGSGLEVQVTGTARTGVVISDSAGTARAAFGYAVSGNDWVTGASAGDTVLLGDSAKNIRLGALGGSAPVVTVDLANSIVGVGGSPVATAGVLQVIISGAAEATAFSSVYGICAFKTSDVYIGARDTTANIEASVGTSSSGFNRARFGALTNHSLELFTNNTEALRIGTDQKIQFASASITANGSGVVTAPGSIGPSAISVQEWLTVKNSGGTTRYVPLYG